MRGPFTAWLAVGLNHNHVRYNDELAEIHNYVTGVNEQMALGRYIALHGLDLE